MKRVLSIFLVVCILNLLFGCTSKRILTSEEFYSFQNKNDHIVVHTPMKRYIVRNFTFTDEYLKGDMLKYEAKNGFHIHVYTDLLLDFDFKSTLMIPMELERKHIQKMTYSKTSLTRNALITTAAILGGGLLIIVIAFKDSLEWGDGNYLEGL